MSDKKYELTDEMKQLPNGLKMYRIRSLIDFNLMNDKQVKAGDLGGWVEHDGNLSHKGKAWVSDDAAVYGSAKVSGDALISRYANVFGNALVSDQAMITDYACVSDDAHVGGCASLIGSSRVFEEAFVTGNAVLSGCSHVYGNSFITGFAKIGGNADVYDYAHISGDAFVSGDASVGGYAHICDGASVKSSSQFLFIHNLLPDLSDTTLMCGQDDEIIIHCSCYEGRLTHVFKEIENKDTRLILRGVLSIFCNRLGVVFP